jgi:sulfite reductase alpha subunit-like flavoprotein
MSRESKGTTVGIWYGADETVVDDFDEHFGADPSYSRSKRIKDAMELAIAVDQALEDAGAEDFDITDTPLRTFLRQAILDEFRDSS